MRFFVILTTLVLAINAASDKDQWLAFKEKFGRDYRNLREEQKRFSIFQDNLRTIEAHNEKYERGEKTWFMGVNQFADMTQQEFKNVLNRSATAKPERTGARVWHKPSGLQAAESVNWLSQGIVTGVKDQGNCGSCWAFGSVAALEGQYALKTGSLVSFSEQNILDCSSVENPCDGGWEQSAYLYIQENGIETESDYPYKAVEGSCQFDQSKSVTKVSGYVDVPVGESNVQDAIATVGPIALGVNANWYEFYAGGILDEAACDDSDINHSVLGVGYDTQNGVEYYLIKNSWGSDWGENGYIKHIRNKNNQCGIGSEGVYPTM